MKQKQKRDHYFIQMFLPASLLSVTQPFNQQHLFFSVNCLFLLSTQQEASEGRQYLTRTDSAEQAVNYKRPPDYKGQSIVADHQLVEIYIAWVELF